MKISKKFLYRSISILVIILLAFFMFVIGRGHTIYFDNKTFESQNLTYNSVYRVDLMVKGELKGQIFSRERISDTCMGQSFNFILKVIESRGDEPKEYEFKIRIPYSWDGVVINLPALINGAEENVYMSKFIPTVVETPSLEDDVVITDEFMIDPVL